jgi:hypothetical protein
MIDQTKIPMPTRDILKPVFDMVKAQFPGDYKIAVRIEYQLDACNGEWVLESEAWAHSIKIEDQSFYGSTFERCLAKAAAEFKIISPARKLAAQKLRDQAAAIEAGEAEIPAGFAELPNVKTA